MPPHLRDSSCRPSPHASLHPHSLVGSPHPHRDAARLTGWLDSRGDYLPASGGVGTAYDHSLSEYGAEAIAELEMDREDLDRRWCFRRRGLALARVAGVAVGV